MITIKEIANQLNVSTTTVSNVIHGKTRGVSEKTIERVQRVLDECNYIPNMSARNLARNDSRIIGIIVKYQKNIDSNFVQDPFTSEILGALEAKIREIGYYTMLYISDSVEESLRFITTWNIDGLVTIGFWPDACKEIQEKFRKPIAFIDSYFPNECENYINVGLEDEKAAFEMTNYLIENGHKEIGFVTDDVIGVYQSRLKGYKRALEEAGLPFKEDHLLRLLPQPDSFQESLETVYKRHHEFSALFVVSDYYAVKIMNDFTDRGVNIPEDISIAGFDDNFLCEIVRPKLTTVHQNPSEKAAIAIDLLYQTIKGENLGRKNYLLPTKLVIRDSVRKV